MRFVYVFMMVSLLMLGGVGFGFAQEEVLSSDDLLRQLMQEPEAPDAAPKQRSRGFVVKKKKAPAPESIQEKQADTGPVTQGETEEAEVAVQVQPEEAAPEAVAPEAVAEDTSSAPVEEVVGVQEEVVEEAPAQAAPSVTVYIYFSSGSDKIADNQSWRQLDELGKALSSPVLAGSRMEIGGHTDSVGSASYNQRLSLKRAKAVSDYLKMRYGVSNLTVKGYGESSPVASNATNEGRAKNRRVVITRLN